MYVVLSKRSTVFVMSVRSTILLNVLTPTLVGSMLLVKVNTVGQLECLDSQLLLYFATCFVGKVCSATWSTRGASA